VSLEVADTGPGLCAAAREHLFEPYFSTRPGQRGLGLATVLGIVRGLGGAIEVCSPPGGGTTFRTLLPVAGHGWNSRGTPESARQAQSWRAQGTVLLVDDEEAILDVTGRLLGSLGCQVITARTGEEAVRLYQQHADEVRVVLLDLILPRGPGEEVLAELRRLSSDLPIIVLSGHPGPDVIPRLVPLGLTGYLQKPYRLPALVEAIRPYLQ
jgi:CheY-like chemotaxis protein